jgi:hypothetical protein
LTNTRYDAPLSDQAFDRLGPQEQSKFARVRNQNNNPEWVPRSDLAPSPAPKPAAAQPEPPAPAPAASVTPDGRLQVGEYLLDQNDIASLISTKAQADLRATQIPTNPESYQAKLPDGFKLPDGVDGFTFNEADPALRDMRAWAHGKGIDQQTFSEMLGFYASTEAQKEAAFLAAQLREVEKLGVMGTTRVTAIEQWLRGTLGDDLGSAPRGMIVTEKIVRGLEALASKFTTQGAAPFSQSHRTPEPAPPGRVSDEEYSRMTSAERWEYARSFPQSQFYPDRKNGGSDR